MPVQVRTVDADHGEELLRVNWAAFGGQPTEAQLEAWQSILGDVRAYGAYDGDRMVGSGGAYDLELTVPGGATLAAGGLTLVGVLPTHRRRGIMRGLMAHHLDDCVEHGEPISLLTASESRIYGRFGYGVATLRARYALETRASEFVVPPDAGGSLRLLDRDEAAPLLATVHGQVRFERPGEVSRSDALWQAYFTDIDEDAESDMGWFHVVHVDDGGEPDGYALHRIKDASWPGGVFRSVMEVAEVASTDPRVEGALWRYLLDVDLVETVEVAAASVDDPLRWRLRDPRRLLAKTVADHLWIRLLDVPAALEARTYEVHDVLRVGVRDASRPATAGTYVLEVTDDGTRCVRTDDDPDVEVDVSTLGSLFLGTARAVTLHRAGLVDVRDGGALDRLDRLFGTRSAPFCATPF